MELTKINVKCKCFKKLNTASKLGGIQMQNIYEKYIEYMSATSTYYVKPVYENDESFIVKNVNNSWTVDRSDGFWASYNVKNRILPVQGWKIHVSTDYSNAEITLDTVSKILLDEKISFKHVKGKKELLKMYSKHGNRISSGKFITIYPKNDEFIILLNLLYAALKDFPKGPYILTDKQWKNSNIFYRYGAFEKIVNDNGDYCIYNSTGNLVPDIREPKYYLPDFIEEPKELNQQNELFENENLSKEETKMDLYKIEKVLKFSNSGGIYVGKREADGVKILIKEARLGIGIDSNNKAAADRLLIEYDALIKLNDVEGIINAVDYFKIWEHTFLVEEFAEGNALTTWITRNYPFMPVENVEIKKYLDNVILIMNKLKNIVTEMHSRGIAMCDLHVQNIIVDANFNIKIIDFEVAQEANVDSAKVVVTRGFHSLKSKLAKDEDWFSLNRILHYLLLPIAPVFDFDANINISHCLWIYDNFGSQFYDYFYDFQIECCKNIPKSDEIFNNTYEKAKQIIESGSIAEYYDTQERIIKKLKAALLHNCKIESESLINGDIRQFETDCGMLNIHTGGFGAVLALNRLSSLTSNIKSWIDSKINLVLNHGYNNAYLTGKAGIACTLYECGYQKEALQIIDAVIKSYDKNCNDLSFRSGLAGIGLALVSLYMATDDQKYLKEAEDIANIIILAVEKDIAVNGSDWEALSLGLFDGYSGLSMFLSFLYHATKNEKYLNGSIAALQKDIDGLFDNGEGLLNVHDKIRNRVLPYLSNGSVGVWLSIIILQKVSNQNIYEDKLSGLKRNADARICLEPSLAGGAASFFILDCFDNNDQMKNTLNKLRPFLIEIEDKIFISGRVGYRLSSDFFSGVSGVILAIESARRKNPIAWLPLSESLWNAISE